jgi:N-acetylmuramoyl-L-alanine amidase
MSDSAQVLHLGDRGSAVADVQARLVALGYPITDERGDFGPETESAVKVFQIRRGLSPDGMIERHTWRELVEAGWTIGARTLYGPRRPPMRGDDVRELQTMLNALGFDAGKEDGIFGLETHEAVREFQHNVGLPADGIAGHETLDALNRLRRRIGPGSKAALRERIARERGGLEGRTVFLDPGHGGSDTGLLTGPGIPESYLVYRVAEAAAAALSHMGARPLLSREIQQGPEVERRCEAANTSAADVAVSLHHACRPEAGPTVAFWSIEKTNSRMGRELAQTVSRALRPRLGSAQILGRNLPFLRDTRMPAVVVDLASVSAEPLLAHDAYLTGLGDAVARGVERYFAVAG